MKKRADRKKKTKMKKRPFSLAVHLVNTALLFFPWMTIGGERYNIFAITSHVCREGVEPLLARAQLVGVDVSFYNLGIRIECFLFLMMGLFGVAYMAALLMGRDLKLNVAALSFAIACTMFNGFGYTVLDLCSNGTFALVYPVVHVICTGVELIGGAMIEAWSDAVEAERIAKQKEEAYKQEVRERLGEDKKYTPLYYHVVWKNFRKNWRDYCLLSGSSFMIFTFILAGFGVKDILVKEHSAEDLFLFKGVGSILKDALMPLSVLSVIIIVLLVFYYLKCRARNYGVFLTLGMRRKSLYHFVAIEFAACLALVLLAGGIAGYVVIFLITGRASGMLGITLHMRDAGVLTFLKSAALLLGIYLVSFMAARDIFYGMNMGRSADLRAIREKAPVRFRKTLTAAGVLLCIDSMLSYGDICNYESVRLLLKFFLGLFLIFRYGMAEYLARERRTAGYLRKLLDHSELYHRMKTGTGYITALAAVQICILFYFPLQIITTLQAQEAEELYPYDIVCFAGEDEEGFFDGLREKYGVKTDLYPMVRVSAYYASQGGFFDQDPVQGQNIGISESDFHALKKKIDPDYRERDLGLSPAGDSVYVVHQQDSSVRAQPAEYSEPQEPLLHVGEPSGVNGSTYLSSMEDPNYRSRELAGEEFGSLIGCFHQGVKENIIVFSDEFFPTAQEIWKTVNANTDAPFESEEEKIPGETLRQGPARLALIRDAGDHADEVIAEVKAFAEAHDYNQPFDNMSRVNKVKTYDPSIKNYYDKQTAVKNLGTERIMKILMNGLVTAAFFAISIVLIGIRMLTELELNIRRAEFLTCMGMRKKKRVSLLRKEILLYYFLLPTISSVLASAGFAAAVFHARMYGRAQILDCLRYGLPFWGIYIAGYTAVLWILVTLYARRVERRSHEGHS